MRRRDFIKGIAGSAAAWPLVAHAQQPPMPEVGVIQGGAARAETLHVTAFRNGLSETGYTEGQNVAVGYHWLEGHYERLPALLHDLIRRRVAVIASASTPV